MPSTISAGTTAGSAISVTGDTTGILQLQTNGTTPAMTIDTSQNVGIGTSSPASYNSFANQLVVGGSGDKGLTIASGTSNYGSIHFADGTSGADSYRGQIVYFHTNNYMSFSTDAAERMRIDSSGNVGIGTTTPLYTFANRGSLTINGTSQAVLALSNGSSTSTSAYHIWDGTNYSINNQNTSGYLSFGTNAATERIRIQSNGRVLVNSTSDVGGNNPAFSVNAADASVFGNIMEARWTGTNSIYHLLCRNGNGLVGGVTTSGSTTAFVTSSDYRLKENIAPMTGALNVVQQLKPVTYNWKADGSAGQGFIAHELQEVVPDCVTGEKDAIDAEGNPKYQGVDTSFLVATLTAAIQEQQAQIEELKAEVQALKGAQ